MASITEFEQYISDYEDMTSEARELAERDRDYFDHIQLTAEETATLQARKQPTSIYNRIRPKVNTLIGMEQQSRTDPKAYPRTPKHDNDAETATEAIRYVCDNNDFDDTASDVFLNLIVEGTGAVDVYGKQKRNETEIKVKHIQWDRLIYDPHSRCPHFSDSRYMGTAVWMDIDEAKESYPDFAGELTTETGTASDTLDDKPNYWTDSKRRRVRVFQLYYKQGSTWYYVEFCKGLVLVEAQPSPYLDDEDEPACSIIAESGSVDRMGNRFGEVRSYIGQQDEVNKRRNKALHLLNQRQTYSTKGAIKDVGLFKKEVARPDGHLEFEFGEFGKDFGIIPTSDMASGNLALLQDAKQEIDAQGANAALSGKMEGSASGRAVQARQQGGQLEVTPLLDRHKQWKKRVYTAVWQRVRQFWKEEKWIRVTDSEKEITWIGLNKPITKGMVLQQQGQIIPPGMEQHPMFNEVVGYENNIAELDVDIVLDEAPDVVTLQHEQFEQLTQLYQANPQAVPFDLIIEASSLRNKSDLVKKMRGEDEGSQQQAQMMQQKQQQAEAMQMAAAKGQIEKTQSETAKNMAQAQKTMVDAEKVKVEALHKVFIG